MKEAEAVIDVDLTVNTTVVKTLAWEASNASLPDDSKDKIIKDQPAADVKSKSGGKKGKSEPSLIKNSPSELTDSVNSTNTTNATAPEQKA